MRGDLLWGVKCEGQLIDSDCPMGKMCFLCLERRFYCNNFIFKRDKIDMCGIWPFFLEHWRYLFEIFWRDQLLERSGMHSGTIWESLKFLVVNSEQSERFWVEIYQKNSLKSRKFNVTFLNDSFRLYRMKPLS